MRLRDRLAVSLVAFSSVALLVSFTTVYLLVQRDELRDLDRALVAEAQSAKDTALRASADRPVVPDGATKLPEVPSVGSRFAVTFDRAGNALGATRTFDGAPPSLDSLGGLEGLDDEGRIVEWSASRGRLRGVVLPIRETGGALYFAVRRAFVDDDLHFLVRVFVALFFLNAIGSVFAARRAGRHLSREVDALANVARTVAEGDLSRRVGARTFTVDETKALGADLDHMIDRLDKLIAAQRVFVSNAAHELRSPLTALRGELQLALRRPRESDEYRRMIEESLSEVELLCALAEDLLTLARSPVTRPDTRPLAVSTVMLDALRAARGRATELGVGVVVEPGPADVSEVPTTGTDVARALRNLVDNASAHAPEGSDVRVHAELRGDDVAIVVDDCGAGVASAEAGIIFEPFYRGRRERAGEGTGAGSDWPSRVPSPVPTAATCPWSRRTSPARGSCSRCPG
ncbi:MAG: HAMP domain-containing sensor histidine kinase [Polyangiaceae bacterium]